jgi:tetratricopeptide (TPR) repeat protein
MNMNDPHQMKWNFKPSQKTFQGRVHRIAVYLQSKVLEIVDSNNSVFYLVYFKNILLGGGNLEEIKQETFLHKAFQQGITLHPSHPLFLPLLPKNRNAHVPDANDVFTQIQNQLSLPEVALAATCMDNFIEKQPLVGIIRQIFDHFKRNGQFSKAYQIAKILLHFSPDIKAMQEMIRTSQFDKYRKADETHPEILLEQEPLLMEQFCYQNRKERKYEIQLHQLLQQQSRPLERLILFINLFEMKHDFYDYDEFIHLLQHELVLEEQYAVLKFLCECSPAYPSLTKYFLQEQIRLKRYPEALSFIVNQIPSLSSAHYETIETILEYVDTSSILNVTNINRIVSVLYSTKPEKKEALVRRLTMGLLKQYDLNQVKTWLEPIRENDRSLRVFYELEKLETLSRDLDQLMKLGELYYQLGLLDQSIECFTWEMELNPTAPDPIRWLSKLYHEKGMTEEADSYKKLSIHMAKRA